MHIIEYKGFQIKPNKNMPTSLTVAVAGKGGKIPAVLDTLFTSIGEAKQTIDFYVKKRDEKGVKDGKASI